MPLHRTYMAKYNWTTEDIGHLLATYPGFEHLKFKLINVSKNHTLEYLMKTCISIRCSLDSEESSSRVVSYLSVRNNMGNKEASNLRMLIINHMRETHGLDLTTRYQAYLLSHGSYVKLTPLQMTPYNIIFVHPLKHVRISSNALPKKEFTACVSCNADI
uniref:Uncharacterized protein n=1 Tax=Romanomermis culicivorax TaxID=13658 RepID=A0A915IDA9_ROMCU